MEEAYAMVFTTIDSEEQAQELARSMVEARLAACVQIEAVRSVYNWQGEVRSDPEWRLTIKTRTAKYAELERHIQARHTYKTPEIVRLEIAGGSSEYLKWMDACVD